MRLRTTPCLLIAMFFVPSIAFAQAAPILDKADTAWMMVCSLLVLMMSLPGLAFFYGGLVKKDNILATAMQTLAVALLVSLLWPALCYSLAFGSGTRWLGNFDNAMLHAMSASSLSGTIPESVFVFFQMTFAIITAGILVGAVADRIKFSTLMVFSTLWIIAVYTPVAHWVWGPAGLIGGLGDAEYTGLFGMGKALDFAGGTVVHITSGVGGLVAALVIGKGRYHAHHAQSNNLLLSVLGASLLWVGWFGFNAGSALVSGTQAGMAMLVTHASAAAGGMAWLLLEWRLLHKPSIIGAISGVVAGLVGITPAAGFVGFGPALLIGALTSGACYLAVTTIKHRFKYDDTLDAFGIHGVGGIVGALLTGVFASADIGGTAGAMEGNWPQLGAQAVAVLVVVAYTVAVTYVILKLLQKTMGLRVDQQTEAEGLDLHLHGNKINVYK